MTLRVLVVGDPYMPVSAYAAALAGLDGRVELSTLQIDEARCVPPRTESERRLREYVGDPAEIARAVAGHDVLIVHGAPVSAEVLGAAPLRLVCCARGGPVNVDVAAATDRGIPVVNTPGKNAEAVAELTIAFALLLIRAVPRASRHLLDGGGFAESVLRGTGVLRPGGAEPDPGPGRARPRRPRGGLAGPGARLHPASGTTRSRPSVAVPGVELVSLDSLLARSDIVSLHARLTPQNRRMFSSGRFAQMRPGSYFINTARESLVDEPALRQALEQGILGGAALDVLERSPPGTGIRCWTCRTSS